jgi:hypothetical protein
LESWNCSCGIRWADHMSNQYRLVQSGKTASGGCSAGPRFITACSATVKKGVVFYTFDIWTSPEDGPIRTETCSDNKNRSGVDWLNIHIICNAVESSFLTLAFVYTSLKALFFWNQLTALSDGCLYSINDDTSCVLEDEATAYAVTHDVEWQMIRLWVPTGRLSAVFQAGNVCRATQEGWVRCFRQVMFAGRHRKVDCGV